MDLCQLFPIGIKVCKWEKSKFRISFWKINFDDCDWRVDLEIAHLGNEGFGKEQARLRTSDAKVK